MGGIPSFEKKFEFLLPNQFKNCIEKMRIRLCERSTILFKKGDSPERAYVVLLGIVYFFDGEP